MKTTLRVFTRDIAIGKHKHAINLLNVYYLSNIHKREILIHPDLISNQHPCLY